MAVSGVAANTANSLSSSRQSIADNFDTFLQLLLLGIGIGGIALVHHLLER